MPICFAFDCDLTLETSQGPVLIRQLHELQNKGHLVFIVSASYACARVDVPHYTPILVNRVKTLEQLKSKVQADRYIYVGDNIIDELAAQHTGWEFIYAKDFNQFLYNLRQGGENHVS